MRSIQLNLKLISLIFVLLIFSALNISAEEDLQFKETYLKPPQDVQDLLNRNTHIDVLDSPGPNGDYFMIPIKTNFSSLKLMSQKTYRLGMLEFCPEVNRDWRLSTYGINGLKIFSLKKNKYWKINIPKNIFISDMVWSPNGNKIAFLAHLNKGSQVWFADTKTGKTKILNKSYVMTTLTGRRGWRTSPTAPSKMLQWMLDGSILTLIVPGNRGQEPLRTAVPISPLIRRTRKKATQTSTFPFLLRTLYDQRLFQYYISSQLAILKGKKTKKIGKPGMYTSISLSPSGKYILAERIVRPFSYITGYRNFPKVLEILDLNGSIVSTIRKTPLMENESTNGRSILKDLPREVKWKPIGEELVYLQKDKKQKKDKKKSNKKRFDNLMILKAPFDINKTETLISTRGNFSKVIFSMNGKLCFISRSEKRLEKKSGKDLIAYDLSKNKIKEYVLFKNLKTDDLTKLNGNIITKHSVNGISYALMSSDNKYIYFQGAGYNKKLKPRPFIDKMDFRSTKMERIFEGSKNYYDKIIAHIDKDMNKIIINRESNRDYHNSFLKTQTGELSKLTFNKNPYPEFEQCKRLNFSFTRRDGLKISGKISLPIGYKKGQKVPAIFWTYPSEFESTKDYKKRNIRRKNLNSFPRMSSRNASDIWLSKGYAVVVPDIPIIGKGKTANNNFIAHLIDSMYSAIRKLDNMGYIDVDRLLHGGHSYGAFATANILARTPFFKAGIAGDGAYNRTLTPMTFQREKRLIWEAQDVYLEMSPFFQADHLDTPILMYHGAVDNNSGTFLIQSERFIQALTGLGKTAALYIYPFESHGPRCIETYYDLWARWLSWTEKYVKNPKKDLAEKKITKE